MGPWSFLSVIGQYQLGPAILLALPLGSVRWRFEVRDRTKEKGERTTLIFQEVKSAAGKRTIPIPGEVLPVLRAHKARQAEEKLFFGQDYQDTGLIFAAEHDRSISSRRFHRSMNQALVRAKIDPAGLHALRHIFATRLLETDEHPRVVQEMLGHSQISLTLDTFSHLSMELKRRAAAKMDEILRLVYKTTRKD